MGYRCGSEEQPTTENKQINKLKNKQKQACYRRKQSFSVKAWEGSK